MQETAIPTRAKTDVIVAAEEVTRTLQAQQATFAVNPCSPGLSPKSAQFFSALEAYQSQL
jgi:hypothetical protein